MGAGPTTADDRKLRGPGAQWRVTGHGTTGKV